MYAEIIQRITEISLAISFLSTQIPQSVPETVFKAISGRYYVASSTELYANAQIIAKKPYSTSSLDYLIYQFSEAYDVDFDLAKAIIECESGGKMVRNPKSSAFGYFQITKSTWKETIKKMGIGERDIKNPEWHINVGTWLLANEGSKHWNASRACWSKKLLASK